MRRVVSIGIESDDVHDMTCAASPMVMASYTEDISWLLPTRGCIGRVC